MKKKKTAVDQLADSHGVIVSSSSISINNITTTTVTASITTKALSYPGLKIRSSFTSQKKKELDI